MRKNKNTQNDNQKHITNKILKIFTNSPYKEFNYKQISKLLDVIVDDEKNIINKVLEELTTIGNLKEVSKGKYKLKSRSGTITGEIDITKNGFAYVTSNEISEDVFVSFGNLNSALHGDTVKVRLYAKKSGKRIEGEVIEIIKRANTKFVGVIETANVYTFLIPDSPRMMYDIFIASENLNGARDGEKVIVEIINWHKKYKNPSGKVIEILGTPGENNTEMHAILAEYGLPYKFDPEIEFEANKINETISDHDYKTRQDFRNITTFTIDPADAKDFDDALSVEFLENGNYRIGVHIADVTHYVSKDTALDKEAYNRATSVYLVDRVVPMLPERLSNNICSLRPNEEKLCFSAIFEMNDNAKIINYEIAKTVIISDKRFSYEEAQHVIENQAGDLAKELLTLNKLAIILQEQRYKQGAFNFDHLEVKFILDENAVPTGVYFYEAKESNHLIEEFMLLANRHVAQHIGKNRKKQDFVYRIHDLPNPEKLESFSGFVSKFGQKIDTSTKIKLSNSMNKIIKHFDGKPEKNIIENLAIRAMSKAVYSSKNIGHYGLAFEYYTHFTSPIRRYPDMMVHRLLHDYLSKNKPETESLEEKCKHCSFMEQQATSAERASIKYKQIEFLKDKVGQTFEGIISGVIEYGFFVELKENACEGLVHIKTLKDDYFYFDAENYQITGDNSGISYQLGGEIKVKIANINTEKKVVDLEISD